MRGCAQGKTVLPMPVGIEKVSATAQSLQEKLVQEWNNIFIKVYYFL